jgi:hypothetical protein
MLYVPLMRPTLSPVMILMKKKECRVEGSNPEPFTLFFIYSLQFCPSENPEIVL